MAADQITVNDSTRQVALRAILRQLEATGIADNFDSLSDALEQLNMWDFVHNQAEVIASLQTFATRDTNIIRKLVHEKA